MRVLRVHFRAGNGRSVLPEFLRKRAMPVFKARAFRPKSGKRMANSFFFMSSKSA
jgi:hypothetical protein